MGRPSSYTVERGEEIARRIAEGETLRSITRDAHMPKWQTVYAWMERDKDFADRIARARELGFDAIAEEALHIANTPVEGKSIKVGPNGKEVTRADMILHRKLQIETRLKLLAKWSPKRYGDKLDVNHSGSIDLASRLESARKRTNDDDSES